MRRQNGLNGPRFLIRTRLWAQILIAMVLGVVAGLVLSPSAVGLASADLVPVLSDWFRLPGAIFLNLIQMVVVPLIVCSIILGIVSAGDPDLLRKVAARIVPYFVTTTAIAVLLGAGMAILVEPGRLIDLTSFDLSAAADQPVVAAAQSGQQTSIAGQIAALIPSNPAEATLNKNMIQIVIATIIAGVAIIAVGRARMRPVLELLELVQKLVLKIVGWAMLLAPLAVFGLITDFILRVGFTALYGMSAYILTVIVGLILLLVFYMLIVAVLAGRSPWWFLARVKDAQLLAFSTSSSAATMPLSLETAQRRLKVASPIARFIVPLGATVNMDGTALYQVVAALFIVQIFGVDLSVQELALLMVTVVGASIGSPSTPGVGIVILATILQSLGIPAAGVAILLGVDRLLDMCRTAVNVTGDLTACLVMNRWLADDLAGDDPVPEIAEPAADVSPS